MTMSMLQNDEEEEEEEMAKVSTSDHVFAKPKSREKKKSLLGLERSARLKRASNISSSSSSSSKANNTERSSKRPRYDDEGDEDESKFRSRRNVAIEFLSRGNCGNTFASRWCE